MAKITFPRTFYAPKGATKITHKATGAEIFIFSIQNIQRGEVFRAIGFAGKAAKPAFNYSFRTQAGREKHIREWLEALTAYAARKAEWKAEKKTAATASRATFEVGDIFTTSWGYDMTIVECFEIIAIKGAYATLQQIEMASESLGYDDRYKGVPQSGQFKKGSKPMRKLIQANGFTIDGHSATKWNTQTVAGVKVGASLGYGGMH